MEDRKAPGPDTFRNEFLKTKNKNGIKLLTIIFNKIYNIGEILYD